VSLDWILFGLRLLSTAILYTFLGLAFYIIWRDLKQAGPQPAPPPLHRLRVIAPAENLSLAANDILPLQPMTLLGRNADSTIPLADSAASGQHARLSHENGTWWIEDLGSRNGTLLNDLPLSKPTSLTDGDIIGIGSLRLKFETMKDEG